MWAISRKVYTPFVMTENAVTFITLSLFHRLVMLGTRALCWRPEVDRLSDLRFRSRSLSGSDARRRARLGVRTSRAHSRRGFRSASPCSPFTASPRTPPRPRSARPRAGAPPRARIARLVVRVARRRPPRVRRRRRRGLFRSSSVRGRRPPTHAPLFPLLSPVPRALRPSARDQVRLRRALLRPRRSRGHVSTNDFKVGVNVEVDNAPWKVIEFMRQAREGLRVRPLEAQELPHEEHEREDVPRGREAPRPRTWRSARCSTRTRTASSS